MAAWIPQEHTSASLLYVYDGHWDATLFDETFTTWGPASVGFGSDLLVFGPQFGKFSVSDNWPRSLRLLSMAMQRTQRCLNKRPLVVFRSPAYNFDPVNTLKQQANAIARLAPSHACCCSQPRPALTPLMTPLMTPPLMLL